MEIKVTLTWAQSIDGQIALENGKSKGISSPDSLKMTHELRSTHQAILVGLGTALADDPLLTCRLEGNPTQPIRIVLDNTLKLPPAAKMLKDTRISPVWILCTRPDASRQKALEERGANIQILNDLRPGSVRAFLETRGISSLLVEGGRGVLTSFMRDRVRNRVVITVAPFIMGRGIEALGPLDFFDITDIPRPTGIKSAFYGNDLVWDLEWNN